MLFGENQHWCIYKKESQRGIGIYRQQKRGMLWSCWEWCRSTAEWKQHQTGYTVTITKRLTSALHIVTQCRDTRLAFTSMSFNIHFNSVSSHTPAALVHSHPGRQRSSPWAAGGGCQSCSPGTTMSHSSLSHKSGPSQHSGKQSQYMHQSSQLSMNDYYFFRVVFKKYHQNSMLIILLNRPSHVLFLSGGAIKSL